MFKWPRVEGVVESLTKTNAIYPLLIAFFFSILIIGVVFTFTNNVYLQGASLLISGGCLFQLLRSYQYFSTNNPDMLRTETHVLQKRVIEMIGDDKHPLSEVATAAIVSTVNPANAITAADAIKIDTRKSQPVQIKDHE